MQDKFIVTHINLGKPDAQWGKLVMYSKKVCKITQSHANAVLDFTNVSILCDMKNSVKDLTIYLQNYKNYNCIFLSWDFHTAGLPM